MSGSNEMFVKIAVELALSVGVILLVLCFGLVLRSLLFRRLTKWAQQTKHDLDDIIISAINGPFVIWFLMLGIYIALHFHELPENVVNTAGKILLALGLFSATLVAANISSGVITHYSSKLGPTLPGATLTRTISRIIIFTVGILVILNALGISITPIIATLGVGGLAVALALRIRSRICSPGFILLQTASSASATTSNWTLAAKKVMSLTLTGEPPRSKCWTITLYSFLIRN